MLVSRRETCLESMKRVSQREVRSIERRWKITGKWPFVTGTLPRIAYLSFAPCVVKGLSTRYGGTTDNVDRWIYFLRRFLFLFFFFLNLSLLRKEFQSRRCYRTSIVHSYHSTFLEHMLVKYSMFRILKLLDKLAPPRSRNFN